MGPNEILILAIAGAGLIIVLGTLALFARFYRKIDQDHALVINPFSGPAKVTFTGGIVLPIINRAELMDVSLKTIEIDRRGKDGLICKDNIRADISVTFFVKIEKNEPDVLQVANLIGCARASDQATIENLFNAKFSEALKTAGKAFDFIELYDKRVEFRNAIMGVIGEDLNGFTLEDTAIDYLEQTPVELLDDNNILDAEGIKKITQVTALEHVQTNDKKQQERMDIGLQNLKADEAIFKFDEQRAEAEAKKDKEIKAVKAQQENEAIRVNDREHRDTMMQRQKLEEEVSVAGEAKLRGIAVAQKNKEREIAVETERVEKARALEQIARERETELGRISKDKEVEVQKKEIADVVRGRVAVEKTVAEEEERIKEVRVVQEADRNRQAKVINAEAEAQEALIKQVKVAEAREQAAKLLAKEKLTIAEADLEVADKAARGEMRIAEGKQATHAAEGLAKVKVREADADALQKQGLAEATVSREKMLAEAKGQEEQGLADARVKEALAKAIEQTGLAESVAIEKKLSAEAAGLLEKANAMKQLDGVGREHEEYRLNLDKEKQVELAEIDMRKDIAHAQASVMGKAMQSAKINIVGGDGDFFDKFVKAVSLGQSADGMIDNSDTMKKLLSDYLQGDSSFTGDVREILSRPSMDSTAIRNLTVSAALSKFMTGADGVTREKLEKLIDRAKDMGLE